MSQSTSSKDPGKQFVWGKRQNKKWITISSIAVVGIAIVLGFLVYGLNFDDSQTVINQDIGEKMVRRAIDGVFVSKGEENPYPVAVMVENLTVVRPQSGLASAHLVYEALAEGGITRFMLIYAGKTPGVVGPVRSARPYFVDWALEYDALYAHAGGSPQSLADIRNYNIFDLNQFFNAQYFYRDDSRGIAREHTLYTTGENLTFALRDLDAPTEGKYDRWTFKDDAPLAERPVEEKTIGINYSSFSYAVEYRYDPTENNYLRYMAGDIHTDADGTDIRPKNVVIQKVATSLADEQRLNMQTIGEGDAIVFRDGAVIEGTWKKAERGDRTMFYDMAGGEIKFNAGQTWIEVVPTDRAVTYN